MIEKHSTYISGTIPGTQWYRIMLGDQMPTSESSILVGDEKGITGSIGFVDLRRSFERLPDSTDRIHVSSVYNIGVEPQHRGGPYFRELLSDAEKTTTEWGLDVITVDYILNQKLANVLPHFGYSLSENRRKAYKHL